MVSSAIGSYDLALAGNRKNYKSLCYLWASRASLTNISYGNIPHLALRFLIYILFYIFYLIFGG